MDIHLQKIFDTIILNVKIKIVLKNLKNELKKHLIFLCLKKKELINHITKALFDHILNIFDYE